MGTTTSTVINTASTTVDAVSSYIWGDMTEVSLPLGQNKEFGLKSDLKFIYVQYGEHYKLTPDSTWTTDKLISAETTLRVFKVYRHGDGHIQIFATFDQEVGIYDVSGLFDAISPLQEKNNYLYELHSPNSSSPRTSDSPSIYDTNTICGIPMKNMHGTKNLSYSKSV